MDNYGTIDWNNGLAGMPYRPPQAAGGVNQIAGNNIGNYATSAPVGNYDLSGGSLALNGRNSPGLLEYGNNGSNGNIDWNNVFSNFSAGAQGILGLASAYNGYQQMKMQKKQYNASLADRNQQIANQAAITNQQLKDRANAHAQTYNLVPGTPEYQQYLQDNQVQVDGSPISG